MHTSMEFYCSDSVRNGDLGGYFAADGDSLLGSTRDMQLEFAAHFEVKCGGNSSPNDILNGREEPTTGNGLWFCGTSGPSNGRRK